MHITTYSAFRQSLKSFLDEVLSSHAALYVTQFLKKINALIKEIERTPYEGSGKPEPLKHNLPGWWLRRINLEHRIVYKIESGAITILQCHCHY